MTKEEILKALEEGITSWGMYTVNWDAMDAIEESENPAAFVEPILELIASHPDIDFGAPGQLVHFVEKFSGDEYEKLLLASVRKAPTPHNIWMVHRCYNDLNNPMREEFGKLIEKLKADQNVSNEIKKVIDEFSW